MAFLFTLCAVPAFAAASAWRAFTDDDNQKPVCFAVTSPASRSGEDNAALDRSFLYLTYRPVERSLNVLSYAPNYRLDPGSKVELVINDTRWLLFVGEGKAWARRPEDERQIANALPRARKIAIVARTAKGTAVTDIFSAAGSSTAIAAARKMCGINN